MALRVLADQVAKDKVLHLRGVLDTGFIQTINQLLADGDELALPDHWDGPKASEFRGMWPGLRRALLDAHADLSELAGSIDVITTQIMSAGGA